MEGLPLQPGAGEVLATPTPSVHGTVTIKVATDAMTVFEAHRPQGDPGGPELHSHPGFDETFYVLSGEWEFTVGERTMLAGAGTVVHVPRGAFHGFRSTGKLDGKFVGVAVPGGIEHYFEEAARTSDHRSAATRHGIRFP
jgi:mannose-6-phosphate isomerase-like protein (cupin superfamily)